MALDRYTPEFLKDATHFQTSADVVHGLWIIETLRRYEGEPHRLLDPLTEAVQTVARINGAGSGRPRGPGRFELAYLAFVFSRIPDVKPFWQRAGHSIWRAADFPKRPSYPLCQKRFAELEHPLVADALEQIARRLIARAVKGSDGRVGRFLHVDATEAETHARLRHVCPSWSACWREKTPGADWRGGAQVSAATPTSFVRAQRHKSSVQEPDTEGEDDDIGDAETLERGTDRLRLKVGGCWYEVLDPTAGARAYLIRGKDGRVKVKRFWVGFYNAKAIDHFTGAPVAVRLTPASTQEYHSYPELFRAAVENTGQLPVAVVGDRGYSIASVFEHNTRRGVASVMPWRAYGAKLDRAQEDGDVWDRHGVVRCKHCGSPTRFVSFARTAGAKRGKELRGPRLYVECLTPTTPKCAGRQSLGCDRSWRMLLPLWRDNPVYLALRHSHDRYERVHHHWRVRWRSGADDHSLRPKRRGIHNQQLRANAALLIEWLTICWRENWMPDSRPLGRPDPSRIVADDGYDHATDLRDYRALLGLDQPYGAKAVELRIGPASPVPSTPSATATADPAEPPPPLPLEVEPDDDALEHLPGSAAEVPLDDLPF